MSNEIDGEEAFADANKLHSELIITEGPVEAIKAL